MQLQLRAPQTSWLIKQAAGIVKGAVQPSKEVSGRISLKHVYEIAKVKQLDPNSSIDSYVLLGDISLYHKIKAPSLLFRTRRRLEEICRQVIEVARKMGVDVVRGPLEADDYAAFLERRRLELQQMATALEAQRQARLLRTSAAGAAAAAAKK